MIECRNLSCAYNGREALRGVSLRVGPGRITGLLGPNGSGKTTLLLALAGALKPCAGAVRLGGRDAAGMTARERARAAASVPQRASTVFPVRCGSLVLMGRYAHLSWLGAYSDRDREAADRAMERTGCLELKDRSVDQVSGGELQRVLIARALAQEAPALLLDEPTASLDAAGAVAALDLFRQAADQGAAVLMALHDLNLAALYCDELAFLTHGEQPLAGSTRDVFTEQTLTRIYGTEIKVVAHPVTGAPQAHFVPGRAVAAAARA